VAIYGNGKQKRTKTRKEKTEEAKNLVAKTLLDSRQALACAPSFAPVGRASACLLLISAISAKIKTRQAEARPTAAKDEFFDFAPQFLTATSSSDKARFDELYFRVLLRRSGRENIGCKTQG